MPPVSAKPVEIGGALPDAPLGSWTPLENALALARADRLPRRFRHRPRLEQHHQLANSRRPSHSRVTARSIDSSYTALLTADEAIREIVKAMTSRLGRLAPGLRTPTMRALLHGRPTRRRLTETELDALRDYR
jgi:hypothetical protein